MKQENLSFQEAGDGIVVTFRQTRYLTKVGNIKNQNLDYHKYYQRY